MKALRPPTQATLRPPAALLACLLAVACAPEKTERSDQPEMLLYDLKLRSYPEEGPPTLAHAERLRFDRGSSAVVAEGLVIDLAEDPSLPGRGGAQIVAPLGQGDIHGKGAALRGPVEVRTGAGDHIRSGTSSWDGERDRLESDEAVRAEGQGYSLSGGSYHYEHRKRELTLEGGVHLVSLAGGPGLLGTVGPAKKGASKKGDSLGAAQPPSNNTPATSPTDQPATGPAKASQPKADKRGEAAPGEGKQSPNPAAAPAQIDLQSPSMTVEQRRRRATFRGGVVLTRGDLIVRCPELVAHYDGNARVRRVVCEGPVDAVEKTRTMHAASGSFDNLSGELRLEGDPWIVDGERRLQGESMVYEVENGRARVERGSAQLPADETPGLPSGGKSSGPLHVQAEEIVYEIASRSTSFQGQVIAKRGKMDLHASRLIVISDAEGKVERAWTEGGPVTATEGGKRATAGKATFAGRGSRLVLDGDPLLTEGASSLRGERVIFYLGEERVEIEKPRAAFPLDEALPGARP